MSRTKLNQCQIVKVIKKNSPLDQLATTTEKVVKHRGETITSSLENDLVNRLLESEKARHQAELRVSQTEKQELENRLSRQENEIKLLTDGTTDMKQFLKNQAKIEAERKYIVKDLKNTRFWQFKKRRDLLNRLEMILT